MLKIFRQLSFMDQLRIFFLCVVALILAACEASSDIALSDPEPVDTTAPIIVAISPDGDEVDFEVDGQIRIEFSELIDTSSITEDESISLFSSTFDEEEPILYSTASHIEVITEINRGEKLNEATGITENTDVSVAYVKPALGRFALNNRYTVSVLSTLRDLVEDDLDTSEDERNFFEGPRATTFTTEAGKWNKFGATKELVRDGEGGLKVLPKPITLPLTKSNSVGDLFYARVSENTNLYVSKFSHNSHYWFNDVGQEADKCVDWDESWEGEFCANSVLVNEGGIGSISSLNLAVNQRFALLTWLQSSSERGGKQLFASIYHDGTWSKPELVNVVIPRNSIGVNMHVASINEQHGLIVWRSLEGSEEIVRAVSFNIADALETGNFGSPLEIIKRDTVSDFNVQSINAVWLNDNSGLLQWTQLDNKTLVAEAEGETESNQVYRIFEREVIFDSTNNGYQWQSNALVDKYRFASDDSTGSVVSFLPLVDSKGDLTLIWKKFDGRLDNLWFAKRVQGVWNTPEKLENNQAGTVIDFTAAFDAYDKLMILWTQNNNEDLMTVFYKSLHSGTSEEDNVELYSGENIRDLYLGLDREGNGHAFWLELETSRKVTISNTFYSKLTNSWSLISELDSTEFNGEVKELNLSMLYSDGRALLLWNEIDFDKQDINQLIFE